jgi:TolB-like protein/class 3 adenylate cyclase/predicted ATPase
MESLVTGESFVFEGFRLDRRGLFRRDERGVFVPVAIGSRAFDVLRVLITAQGDLVAKDEIMAAVWPGTVVEDNNLTIQISALRRVLDPGRLQGSCIQTVARRGYRFLATVTRRAADAGTGTAIISGTGARPPSRLSIVVMPFTNLSNDPDQEYFADGITDDLTTDLSRISGSFVIARSTAFTYKGKAVDAKQIGRELGVRCVLEGSVRRTGDQVRVNVQLIDSESGTHLWAARFDADRASISESLNEITGRLARILTQEPVEAAGGRTERQTAVDREAMDPGEEDKHAARARKAEAPISSGSRGPVAERLDALQAHPERRLITVLSCGILGSAPPASELDPEEALAKLAALHHACAAIIGRYVGFVAKFHGDGLLAYFGYPQAHEDDAERAVRAGIALVDAIGQFGAPPPLRVRIGVSTGVVVVGDLIGQGEAQDRGIVGEAPNLAATLQTLAEPNAIVIADSTRDQVGALFEVADLGPQQLRGFGAPQHAWRILGGREGLSRFEALRSGGTPLIGREEEIELLSRRWSQAKAGAGRVVLISGEPGIGKSRLAEAFRECVIGEPHARLRYFCSPHHQDSALFPIIGQLERAAGFEGGDTPEAKLDKLAALIAANAPAEGDVPLLAELLSVPFGGRYVALDLTAQRKKEKTFEALLRQFAGLARQQPVLMIFEDLHWADPTSRELLDLIVEQVERLPALLIATFRPEFHPSWTGQSHLTTFSLRRLGPEESDELVRGMVGNIAALSSEVVDEIVERSDGVPLFLEELTKAVIEIATAGADAGNSAGSAAPATSLAVPATLHASLIARLDHLGPTAREIAQVGAAIGRDFSYELLAATAERTEAELRDALGRLVDAGLVFQRGVVPQATFLFKHALVQDTAYGMLLRGPRQQLHAQIAKALEAHSPELMDTQPELFAQHYAEAGLVEKSVACWGKAGHSSIARSAMAEAAAQFRKGLDQLALLPNTLERQQRELEFRIALGAVLFNSKGAAAPETGDAYARARELWEQLGSPTEFLEIPFGQSRHHLFRGEFDLALRLAEDLLRLSRQHNDNAGLILGHYSSGRALMLVGRFASSRSHLEEALALYDPSPHRLLAHQTGDDPRVTSQAYLGVVLHCLGYPEQALARSNAAIAEARTLAYPPSLAASLALNYVLLSLGGDDAALDERADQLAAAATEQGFAFWSAVGTIFRGWGKVKNGDVPKGISLLRSGLDAYRATGTQNWIAHHTALLARACEIAGQIEEAATLLDDALQMVERTEERWFAAELNRHKGQLLLRQGHSAGAEELHRKALSIAEEQGAKLWELRAAASLAQLWRDQGRHIEARDLLAPVYGWFTEGHDTPDLKAAKALLADLE